MGKVLEKPERKIMPVEEPRRKRKRGIEEQSLSISILRFPSEKCRIAPLLPAIAANVSAIVDFPELFWPTTIVMPLPICALGSARSWRCLEENPLRPDISIYLTLSISTQISLNGMSAE